MLPEKLLQLRSQDFNGELLHDVFQRIVEELHISRVSAKTTGERKKEEKVKAKECLEGRVDLANHGLNNSILKISIKVVNNRGLIFHRALDAWNHQVL